MSYKYRCIHDLVSVMNQILIQEFSKKIHEPITKINSTEIFYNEASKYGAFNKVKTKDELPW